MAKRKSNVAKCKVWTDSAVMELEGSIVGVAREMGMTLDIDHLERLVTLLTEDLAKRKQRKAEGANRLVLVGPEGEREYFEGIDEQGRPVGIGMAEFFCCTFSTKRAEEIANEIREKWLGSFVAVEIEPMEVR